MTAMSNFIEDYLYNPAQAISSARERADLRFRFAQFDEEQIYREISTSEYRLYEAVVVSDVNEDTPRTDTYAVVA